MALDWKQVAQQEGLTGDNTSPSNEPTAVAVRGPAKKSWQDVAQEEGLKPLSTGEKVGQYIRNLPTPSDVTVGTGENLLTAVTGTGATVVGDALGLSLDAANKIRSWFGLSPTQVKVPGSDKVTTEGGDFARGIKEAGTYVPRTETGKNIAKGAEVVLSPITATGKFVGDVTRGLGAADSVAQTAEDTFDLAAPVKLAKVAPKIASTAGEVASKVGEKTGPVLGKAADVVTDPHTNAVLATGHLMYGNIPGALINGGIATGRILYDNMKGKKVGAELPATDTALDTGASILDGLATTDEVARIAAQVDGRRAAARRAYEERTGNKVRSTFNDTYETQRAADKQQFIDALRQQESNGGKVDTSKPNYAGAIGEMQIIPGTFQMMKDKGLIPKDFDFNNPAHNKAAGEAYASYLYDKYNGNTKLAAAAYYGGEGAVRDGQIIRRVDTKNPNAPDTLQYAEQVQQKIAKAAPKQESVSTKVDTPIEEPSVDSGKVFASTDLPGDNSVTTMVENITKPDNSVNVSTRKRIGSNSKPEIVQNKMYDESLLNGLRDVEIPNPNDKISIKGIEMTKEEAKQLAARNAENYRKFGWYNDASTQQDLLTRAFSKLQSTSADALFADLKDLRKEMKKQQKQ